MRVSCVDFGGECGLMWAGRSVVRVLYWLVDHCADYTAHIGIGAVKGHIDALG